MMTTETGSNLSLIKKQNSMLIKESIYRHGPISRSEVARRLALTNPTITTNVANLIENGLLQELDSFSVGEKNPLGRRPILLDFVSTAYYVVGIELGRHETLLLLTDLRGNVVCKASKRNTEMGYQEMIETLAEYIQIIIKHGKISTKKIAGVGICLPGFVDAEQGIIHNNVRQDWVARELAKDIQQKSHYPTCMENNVRARTVGADLFRCLVKRDPLLYYFMSYGLACTLMANHQVISGQATSGGEIGHMVVEMDGPRCETCGNRGCLEAVASENAILKRCNALIDSEMSPFLQSLRNEAGELTIAHVLNAQKCGDVAATAVINDAVRYIGVNLANLINFIGPKQVLVEGRIFSDDQNQQALISTASKNVFGGGKKGYEIEFVEYDRWGAAKGAASVAVKKFVLE